MTERLKKSLEAAANKNGQAQDKLGLEEHQVGSNVRPELQCKACTKPVTVTCWACVDCATDVLICEECEKKEAPILESFPEHATHRSDHPLLRIHNLLPVRFEREKVDATVARINTLETAVNEKLRDLDSRMGKIENKVEEKFGDLDTRIGALESKVEEKLTSFEALLKKIALHLNVAQE
ncbi:hypothetical protein AN958_10522 [Leucoagaricus sp. SymC.cos]|nr:hypothetical protein AN958_10522 [Leucoagaricus sp. SymC.cos]